MTTRNLAAVRTRLEDAVRGLPVQATNSAVLFDFYEEIAIQVLDSSEGNYMPGILEEYLQLFLKMKRLELGLTSFPELGGG